MKLDDCAVRASAGPACDFVAGIVCLEPLFDPNGVEHAINTGGLGSQSAIASADIDLVRLNFSASNSVMILLACFNLGFFTFSL